MRTSVVATESLNTSRSTAKNTSTRGAAVVAGSLASFGTRFALRGVALDQRTRSVEQVIVVSNDNQHVQTPPNRDSS